MRENPFRLLEPGYRGRKSYYFRGSYKGKRYDVSLKTDNVELARKRKSELEARIFSTKQVDKTEVTFAFAAEAFKAWRNLQPYDVKRIDDVKEIIGDRVVATITQADIVAVADQLRGGYHPATRNRDVVRPIATVLHYAADNNWCAYKRFRSFREPKPEKRTAKIETARVIIDALEDEKKLLILWLFKHGDRISDALSVKGSDIDLNNMTYKQHISKSDKWRIAPLDKEVVTLLRKVHKKLPEDKIFHWCYRQGVYKWLRPLCKELGVTFTPHMARHSILSWIGNNGGSLLQIKGRSGHANIKSAEPYLNESMDAVRKITAQFRLCKSGKLG